MAYTKWRGPGALGAPLQSGNFENGLHWTRGDPPGDGDIADLPGGDYTVTLSSGASIGTLLIGQGVTFLFKGNWRYSLGLGDQSANSGTLHVETGLVRLGGAFYNFGTLIGDSASSDDALVGGTLVNQGLIIKGDANFNINSDLDNRSDGVLRATQSYNIYLLGSVTNAGLFEADGSTIVMDNFRGTSVLGNLAGATLSGGQWHVANGGTIRLFGQAVQTLGTGADIVLDGRGSSFASDNGDGLQALDTSLRTIAADAELHLLGRRGFGADQDLDVRGALELRGGILQIGELDVLQGATLTGFGTVNGEGNLSGAVAIAGGTLRFTDDVTVKGAISGGALALGGRDNLIGPDAHVTVRALTLEDGITRVQDGSLHARNVTVHDATLDLGGTRLTLPGALGLESGRVNGAATLRLTGDHLTSAGESAFGVDVTNLGTITVDSGRLTFDGRLSGAGAVVVEDGAALAFGAGAAVTRTQSIALAGASSLTIAAPTGFAAALSGFGAGDAITLQGLTADATRVRWVADADGSGGTLTLIGDASRIKLHFDDGAYGRRDFLVGDASGGGVTLTYQARGHASLDVAAAFGPDTPGLAADHHVSLGWLHAEGHHALV